MSLLLKWIDFSGKARLPALQSGVDSNPQAEQFICCNYYSSFGSRTFLVTALYCTPRQRLGCMEMPPTHEHTVKCRPIIACVPANMYSNLWDARTQQSRVKYIYSQAFRPAKSHWNQQQQQLVSLFLLLSYITGILIYLCISHIALKAGKERQVPALWVTILSTAHNISGNFSSSLVDERSQDKYIQVLYTSAPC